MIQISMKAIQGKIYMIINLTAIKTKILLNKVFIINNLLINSINRIIPIKKQINFPINNRLFRKKTFLMQSLKQLHIKNKPKHLIKKQILMRSLICILIKNRLKHLIKYRILTNKSFLIQVTSVGNYHQKKAQAKATA
jgi:hypothetical protein